MENSEKTLVLVKPDGVQRGLIGEVIGRFERRGMRIAALKLLNVSRKLAEAHYAEHKGKPFYAPLIEFITSDPTAAMVVEGPQAVSLVRSMMGALKPEEAAAGTIRGDFTVSKQINIVHGSDSPASAKREIALFFAKNEIVKYRD